jgi:hypothetical protein
MNRGQLITYKQHFAVLTNPATSYHGYWGNQKLKVLFAIFRVNPLKYVIQID